MQYILTEEEFLELKNTKKLIESRNERIINDLCQMVADHMPITEWPGTKDNPKPWMCIYSKKHEWYCDDCPVINFCTRSKHFSK